MISELDDATRATLETLVKEEAEKVTRATFEKTLMEDNVLAENFANRVRSYIPNNLLYRMIVIFIGIALLTSLAGSIFLYEAGKQLPDIGRQEEFS